MGAVLHHFSEDPTIGRFVPHVPRTNPTHRPGVWAIDAEHAPLYWFPRHCPRVTAWPRTDIERPGFASAWASDARRVHAIEWTWFERMRTTTLYRYDLPARTFDPLPGAVGHWFSEAAVEPLDVTPLEDLVSLHASAGIELRLVTTLVPIRNLAVDHRWEFGIVRLEQ